MKRLVLAAAVVVIAAAVLVFLTIPPAQLVLPDPRPDGSVPGVLHVHTDRSDGHGTIDEVAAAAARAGLTFVIITDHGNATAAPEPPAYRSGVLCIDAVEISTAGGHLIALDMPAAPYPLAGEPADVLEDMHRLGGFAIAAHPDSPKAELRWPDRDLPFDGLETLNLDTGWRMWVEWAGWGGEPDSSPAVPGQPTRWRARGRLAAALLGYPFRPVQTIRSLIPPQRLDVYEAIAARRRVVSLAGADAHAQIAFRGDPAAGGPALPIPGYESTFRAMSVHVRPERPLTGDPVEDAQLLLAAIRGGRAYTALDAIATPPSVEFSASSALGNATEGGELPIGGPVTFRVRSNMPPGFVAMLQRGGETVGSGRAQDFTLQATEPGAYSLAIDSDTLGATWIRTNPIYLRGPAPAEPSPARTLPPPESSWSLFDGRTPSDWTLEHDPTSQAALEVANLADGPALRLRYGLGGGTGAAPFVGLVHQLPDGSVSRNRLAFTIRAEQPMRVSVQARVPPAGGYPSERWQKSIYVDATPREYEIVMDDLAPVGTTHAPKPLFGDVRTLLFVIDTVNTKPGAAGRVWVSRVRFER